MDAASISMITVSFNIAAIVLILVMVLTAIFVLSGVAVGGLLVFRTKRDVGEPLFGRMPEGRAFISEDEDFSGPEFNPFGEESITKSTAGIPPAPDSSYHQSDIMAEKIDSMMKEELGDEIGAVKV